MRPLRPLTRTERRLEPLLPRLSEGPCRTNTAFARVCRNHAQIGVRRSLSLGAQAEDIGDQVVLLLLGEGEIRHPSSML